MTQIIWERKDCTELLARWSLREYLTIKELEQVGDCREEVPNYQNFLRLCNEIVQVTEKICDLRPIA